MASPQLERIDLQAGLNQRSRDTVAALGKLLSPHAPRSLHILGTILNTRPRTKTIGNVDPDKVILWSTTPLQLSNDPPPELFSILIFSPASHQFRFFCSAESAEGRKPEEEAHVVQIFQEVLRMAAAETTYDSVLTMKSANHGSVPTERVDSDPRMIVVGSIDEKWRPCLAALSECQNPSIRYIMPPSPLGAEIPTNAPESSRDWVVDQIQESDIGVIRASSSVPRPREYIMSRAPYSVCIRTRGQEGLSPKPIAWALMHADGSIGTLHVDSGYRRSGLAKFIMSTLVKKLDLRDDGASPSVYDDLGGGALGWNWTDTDEWNDDGRRFFEKLAGWQMGWTSHWTYMVLTP
ncbi:hypothetical protein HYDPIDRAFT_110586 [Hydnomerulius pinastri MD-312]|nr:hypothetical protein HYDPIDRAFT_110586 [Hydnomerulius pinastri MD-312]